MTSEYNLNRFIEAQEQSYRNALSELKNGRKVSHWMWYIFPQPDGLGYSTTSKKYAIKSQEEAKAYLKHPVLRERLIEISEVLLTISDKTAHEILGSPDDLKLQSCMTLFAKVKPSATVFEAVLMKYFAGEKSLKTLKIIESM